MLNNLKSLGTTAVKNLRRDIVHRSSSFPMSGRNDNRGIFRLISSSCIFNDSVCSCCNDLIQNIFY